MAVETQTLLTPEEYARRSASCWACSGPLDKPDEALCYGCGQFFCGKFTCPASDREMDVPWGKHDPEAHLDAIEDDDEEGDED